MDEERREVASRRTALISAADIAGRCFRRGGPDPSQIFDYFYWKFCEELGIGRLIYAERKMRSPFGTASQAEGDRD